VYAVERYTAMSLWIAFVTLPDPTSYMQLDNAKTRLRLTSGTVVLAVRRWIVHEV
jgi:hypothetical protein